MEHIDIVLKNEKIKTYYLINWFILVIHLAYYSFLFYNRQPHANEGLIVIAISIAYRVVLYYTRRKPVYPDIFFYLLASMVWVSLDNILLAIIVLALGIFSSFATNKLVISFSEDEIKKGYFPFTRYSWDQVDNVIIKDDILTLDFKNNKVIQAEVETEVNEPQFNEFALRSLARKQQ